MLKERARKLVNEALLYTAERYMKAYQAEEKEINLSMAKVHLKVAYDRGADVTEWVNHLLDICYELDKY
jgi:hypothetical protein